MLPHDGETASNGGIQLRKDTYCVIPLTRDNSKSRIYRDVLNRFLIF